MRKTIQFLQLAFLLLLATACAETSPFKYESVPNDPLKARIYTLDNGLNYSSRTAAVWLNRENTHNVLSSMGKWI